MEYNNKMYDIVSKCGGIDKDIIETMTILLAPFVPHVASEIWEQYGHDGSIFDETWPEYDEDMLVENTVQIAVQINGKTKGTIEIGVNDSKDAVISAAKEKIASKLTGNVIKEIYVPGRIVNIVMK